MMCSGRSRSAVVAHRVDENVLVVPFDRIDMATFDVFPEAIKRILEVRQGVGSSAHLKLEKNTVLMAGTASRRGTRLSSMDILEYGRPIVPPLRLVYVLPRRMQPNGSSRH